MAHDRRLGHSLWMRTQRRWFFYASRDSVVRSDLGLLGLCAAFALASCARRHDDGSPLRHGYFLRRVASGLRHLSLFHRTEAPRVNPEPFLNLDRVIHEK